MKTSLPDRSDVLQEVPHAGEGWLVTPAQAAAAPNNAAEARRLMVLTPQLRTLAHIRSLSSPRSF